MFHQPLAEVFGFPVDNFSSEANRHRSNYLCPYQNRVPNCTKDKAKNPLGVCSIFEGQNTVITCPIRFRERWQIAEDAARFFFPANSRWTSLTEVRLADQTGHSAGNLDLVLVSYDSSGQVLDFGAVEIQAVYISGNVRNLFEFYMENPQRHYAMLGERTYPPRPDYLSSSRKRLAPQLLYKGGILKEWKKKTAIVIDNRFFASLPTLPQTEQTTADMAWLVYDLKLDAQQNQYRLTLTQSIYTAFDPTLKTLTTCQAGPVEDFIQYLQHKLEEKLEGDRLSNLPLTTKLKRE